MNDETSHTAPTPAERKKRADSLARAAKYGSPGKVWVEDGHVFLEGFDGTTISMTPKVAIEMGRLLSDAGAESLINSVMDDGAVL